MNEEAIKALYESISGDYEVGTIDEFKIYLSDETKRAKFFDEVIKPEYDVESLEQFETVYGLKKKVVTPADGVEEVTVSTTETETPLGSSDGLEVNVEQTEEVGAPMRAPSVRLEVNDKEKAFYLEEDLNSLMDLETATYDFDAAGSARARMMRQMNRSVDPELKKKILSDFNISSSIKLGVINEALVDSALRGDKKSIETLRDISIKNPEYYQSEKNSEKLQSFDVYSEKQNYTETEEDKLITQNAVNLVAAFDAETKILLDAKPNATEEEMQDIFNREGAPTEEQYEIAENSDYQPTGFEDEYIGGMYNQEALIKLSDNNTKFSIAGFNGYLNKKGYKKKYRELTEDESISQDSVGYDYFNQYSPTLASERIRYNYLKNYLAETDMQRIQKEVLDYQVANGGKNPFLNGDGDKINLEPSIEIEELNDFVEDNFKNLNKALTDVQQETKANYQRELSGGSGGDDTQWLFDSGSQAGRSVNDRISSVSEAAYGWIGMDSTVDKIRLNQAETELNRDDMLRYTYASGKSAFVNGREYLIDDKGEIFDLDLKIRVSSVLEPSQIEEIRKGVEKNGVKTSSFSGTGAAVTTAGVAADVVLQLALTRGVGVAGQTLKGIGMASKYKQGRSVIDLLSKVPMKATTASSMIAQGTLMGTSLASDVRKQALDAGMSIEEADDLSQTANSQGFILGVVTGPLSTQTGAMQSLFGGKVKEKVISETIRSYAKGAGIESSKSTLRKMMDAIIKKAPGYIKAGGAETFQENVQQSGQAFVIGADINERAGREIMSQTISGDQFMETSIISFAAGMFMPFAGDLKTGGMRSYNMRGKGFQAIDEMKTLALLSKNSEKTKELLNSQVKAGVYTQQQVDDMLADINIYKNNANSLPPNLSAETSLSVLSDLNKIKELEAQKAKEDPSFAKFTDEKIRQLRNRITKNSNFDYISNRGKQGLMDEAGRELVAEKEAAGDQEFSIDNTEIRQRAIDNFNELSQEEQLKFIGIETEVKVTPEQETEVKVTPEQETEVDRKSRIDIAPKIFGKSHTDKKLPYGRAVIADITSPDSKGVQTAKYNNPQTGELDVIISSSGDSANFVGFTRVYENGKPTNKFTAKMESTGDAFKNIITEAENALPDGAEVVETTTISIGGLKTYNKSKTLNEKVDSDGNVVTKTTRYSDATQQSVKEKGNEAAFSSFRTDDKTKAEAEVEKIKEAYPGIEVKIKTQGSKRGKKTYTIDLELPVLVKRDAETAEGVQEVETEVKVTPEQETEVNPEKTERLKDSQIPVSQQSFTYEDMNGDIKNGTITTKLDGSREVRLTDEEGNAFYNERISKDNTLTNEEYVTLSTGGNVKTTEDVDIKTVRGPKLESKMSDRQRKASGIDTQKDESEQTVSEIDEVTVTEEKVVTAGKGLFNNPNPETTEISKKYKKDRNDETPEGEPITSIDKDNSREIADVYESLEDSPNDSKVQEAYLLMADETGEQYKEIADAGYEVEIWKGKGEPYANAKEMIDDVRENKHMWIYSTEAGFGDTEITEEQRQQNKLLQDSGFKDKNGDTLLYNDLFRFVHDFFGHTERGNGFGPVGEENAWDVHSRMYTPLARRAMTTETRGQNSWVNFGPQMRNDKGELIKKGEEGYIIPKERAFAPQKMALMPEKYSELLPEGEVDSGDKKVAPSKTPATKDKAPSTKKVETSVSKLSQEFKSGKPSMEEVYNKAEDLGIPLKEAREYLEEVGYTEKEIKDFVIKREDMSVKRDVAGEKNIFVKGKNITLNFLDKIKRQAASAKSYMPKNAFIAKEIKNAHIQSEIKVAERIAKRLNKMLKGKPDSVYDEVNKLMRGEEADLPIKIALIATAMRNHIDSLSEKLVMSGAVESEGAAANIMSNIGTYMNRSYRLFDDKNYADNISEEVILEAKEFLKAQELNRIIKEAAKENITPQEYVKKQKGSKNFTVEQYVDAKSDQSVRRIINKNEANAFVSAVSNEAKKDTKIFKERKEIPAEIRALMGEYTDAAYNYVMSVGKVKAIIETQKYLDKLKDIGDGVFLFEDGDIRIPDTGYTKIAAETNQSLAPLNGYHAPTELVDQMNSGPLNAKGLGEFWQKAFVVYMKGIGAVKYTKTILSVGTHFKNVLGNAYFMAQNGYFNPKDYNEAYKVLKNEFKNLDNEQLNKKLDEYIKAGIINQGVSLREVQGLLEGEQDFDVTIEKRTAERSENKIKKAAKNLGKNLEELYQAEDDLFKIVAYENEKRDYAKIDFDKKYEELSEKEKAKVDSKVAEIVKNILPNYSRLGNISKILRVAPVATFISFQLEAYRTAANTLDLSLKEVKSKNPRKRKKGAKRLTSLIGFQALKYSVLGMLGNYLLGDDDEDEEESKIQEVLEGSIGLSKPKTGVMDARPFLPFWSQNSDILITKAGNGEFSYIDMSASDPYGGLAKVVRAAQRSETIEEGIISAAEELMSPILSTDILSGTIASLLRNEDVYGKKIWEKTDSPDDRAIKMIDAIYKTLEPGTLTSLRKIAGMNTPGKAYTDYGRYVTKMMDKDNRAAEAIGQVTGFKKNDVDVEMQMNYLLGDLKEDMKPIEIKKYIAKKRIETTGDAREYVKLIKSEHPDKYEIYKEASKIVKGAQKFGLSIEKIYPILRSKFPNGDDADIIFLFDQIKDQIIPKDE